MILQQRIQLLSQLGKYIEKNTIAWQQVKQQAERENPWFVKEFIEMAASNIASQFLQEEKLHEWVNQYKIPEENNEPSTVGVVMAGNIPLVGFHDMLCIFITGHKQRIKTSNKDSILIRHLVDVLVSFENDVAQYIVFAENLKGCDAYIATGSNNSSRYFDYYFGNYPHIIRRNRTSVAILDGKETSDELACLADDIQTYFGLGCRNVTKIFVPDGYNFEALLSALNKYAHYSDFHKYKNNYDYQLALMMMSNKFYMTNGSVLIVKNESLFTPVSQINYAYYGNKEELTFLQNHKDVQCIVGHNHISFGQSQKPGLTDYADGVDTMWFALSL